MSRFVYADNAATTRMSDAVRAAMMPYLDTAYGNPSSVYQLGREARRTVDEARDKIAAALGAQSDEIYFTGSGTESDNWALRAVAASQAARGKHIITSVVEHHAVTHTLQALEKEGFSVSYLPVDEYGRISLETLVDTIREDTILISIMMGNNEIGTLYPVNEIGALARARGVLFHTDAVQAAGHVPIDVAAMQVDLMSLSAHKFHGPRGIGALYMRRGLRLPALITGGGQEHGRRAGTENVAGICGMAAALQESVLRMGETNDKVTALRDRLIACLTQIPRCRLTGDPVNRLPGIASFAFDCVEGEAMILMLDAAGIAASSGSACSSGSLDPSHVLLAIGLPHETAHGSVRFSFGEENTQADVDYIAEIFPPIVEKLRAMSPLWEGN